MGYSRYSAGYFDKVLSSQFHEDPQGRVVYFPWGTWGRGYVVESVEKLESLERLLKRFYSIWLVLPPLLYALMGNWIGPVIAALPIAYVQWEWTRMATRDLEISEMRLSRRDLQTRLAGRSSLAFLAGFLLPGTLFFWGATLWILVTNPSMRLWGVFSIVIWSYFLLVVVRMIRWKCTGQS